MVFAVYSAAWVVLVYRYVYTSYIYVVPVESLGGSPVTNGVVFGSGRAFSEIPRRAPGGGVSSSLPSAVRGVFFTRFARLTLAR